MTLKTTEVTEQHSLTADEQETRTSESEDDQYELACSELNCEGIENCTEFLDNSDAELEFDESFSEKETSEVITQMMASFFTQVHQLH